VKLNEKTRLENAIALMSAFARETGLLDDDTPPRRYLWTDAFAVCNFFELARRTGENRYRKLALKLIGQVHDVLGRFHPDSGKRGWISGLDDEEAARHPTLGGLRIGKKLNERGPDEAYDEALEWDRDGQYFHYLTKWMHALHVAHAQTGNADFHRWAVELARVAVAAFSYRPVSGQPPRMFWKMRVDLSAPLVPSMGQHDPLDGLLTCLALEQTTRALARISHHPSTATAQWHALTGFRSVGVLDIESAMPARSSVAKATHAAPLNRLATNRGEKCGLGVDDLTLKKEITLLEEMCEGQQWATADVLGIGGLLTDCWRLAKLQAGGIDSDALELPALLEDAARSMAALLQQDPFRLPRQYRLAFRELGLAIGLAALPALEKLGAQDASALAGDASVETLTQRLRRVEPLAETIVAFWLQPDNRDYPGWRDHLDINRVMLATSLTPDTFLEIPAAD